MWIYLALYFGLAIAALVALTTILIQMGHALATCPVTGQRAKAAALVIGTGFVAIGGGAALIGAALLPQLGALDVYNALGTAGVLVVTLGAGFAQAAGLMRQAVFGPPLPAEPVPDPQQAMAPA